MRTVGWFAIGWLMTMTMLAAPNSARAGQRWVGGGTCRSIAPNDYLSAEDNAFEHKFTISPPPHIYCPVASDSLINAANVTEVRVNGNCGWSTAVGDAPYVRLCRKDWSAAGGSFICGFAQVSACEGASWWSSWNYSFIGGTLSAWQTNAGYPYVHARVKTTATVNGIYVVTNP